MAYSERAFINKRVYLFLKFYSISKMNYILNAHLFIDKSTF